MNTLSNKDAGELIKIKLKYYHLSLVWLADALTKRGLEVDNNTLSQILRGIWKGNKADAVILKALEIISSYEDWVRRGYDA